MFNAFKKNKKKEPSSLKEAVQALKDLEGRFGALSKNVEEFKTRMKKAVTKVGIVRFNPFHEIGSDQSFSVALLDQGDNGFVFTSHYLQDANRVYAKPIKKGKSEYSLSEEEKEAIEKATNI